MAFGKFRSTGSGKRKGSFRLLTGDKEIDRKLNKLKASLANSIVRPAAVKGLRIVLKSVRASVPSQYKSAKRSMGKSMKKGRGSQVAGKVGAAVGIKQESGSLSAFKRFTSGGNRGGAGIGVANIHWAMLGTTKRTRASGGDTGRMPPILADAVKAGWNRSKGAYLAVMRGQIWMNLKKQVAART